mgnify:CR=1 FL=1
MLREFVADAAKGAAAGACPLPGGFIIRLLYLPAAAMRPARRPKLIAIEWLAPATVTG